MQTPRWPKLTDWQTTSRHEPNQQQATPPPLSTREAWEALSYFAFFFFIFFVAATSVDAGVAATKGGPTPFRFLLRYIYDIRAESSVRIFTRSWGNRGFLASLLLFFQMPRKNTERIGRARWSVFSGRGRSEKGENVPAERWKVLGSLWNFCTIQAPDLRFKFFERGKMLFFVILFANWWIGKNGARDWPG